MLSERDVTVGGLRLRCGVGPSNGAPLVLLHGACSRWQAWERLAPDLADDWTVVAVDLRGHGASDRTPGHYTLSDSAGDVVALLREGLQEPAVLFGHSYGALVAMLAAEAEPELVSAVIWGDCPVDRSAVRTHLEGQREMNVRWRGLCGGRVPAPILEAQLRAVPMGGSTLEGLLGAESPWFEFTATSLYQHDPAFLEALLDDFDRMFAAWDPDRVFGAVRCPLLLLQGDPQAGGLLKPDALARVRGLRPDAAHAQASGVGHALHTQNPEAVAPLVRSFLDGLGVPAL